MYDPTKPYKHRILKLIESTWSTPYVKVERGLYPIFKKRFSTWEVQHTDGIGTKGIYHWRKRTFDNAVLDALAMNLNDLAMVGAVPYAIQNHIILPRDDRAAIMAVVGKLARECKRRNIAMTGGETSIHSGTEGMDISITVSAFLKERRKNLCKVGDVLVGLPSNGLHSNGLTKVREVFGEKYRRELVAPTRIYLDEILSILDHHQVHGMMHITGGAFTKLKDILPSKTDATIAYAKRRVPKIFRTIRKSGVSDEEMFSTFNCGVGFVLSVPPKIAPVLLKKFPDSFTVGEIIRGAGKVRIRSPFNGRLVTL